MKRLMLLLQYTLEDSGVWCRTSTDRDWKTISARVEEEGESFLTITLPNFGKDFQKSLDQGFVGPDAFAGFKRRGGLPVFLRGFLSNIFDPVTGVLIDVPFYPTDHPFADLADERVGLIVNCIRAVRQITLMFSKINEESTSARTRKAILEYLLCEEEVRAVDATFQGGVGREIDDFLFESDTATIWRTLQFFIREDIEFWSYPTSLIWLNGRSYHGKP